MFLNPINRYRGQYRSVLKIGEGHSDAYVVSEEASSELSPFC